VTLADAKGTSHTVEFGATRSDGNSVYAKRETQVFTVGSSITDELSKEAVAFREPHLVRFDRARVAAVSGSFGPSKFALERQASGWIAAGKPVPATGVDDLFSAIADIKSRSFLDEPEAAVSKGREPEASVILKSPGEEQTIRVYALRGETRATVTGRPGSFLLPADPNDALRSAFQKAATPVSPTPAPKKK
jgi:hypothetical protein